MAKRSDFPRRDKDFYPTPLAAARPLFPWLPSQFNFSEPCAGAGDMCNWLEAHTGGRCVHARDLDPEHPSIEAGNALDIKDGCGADLFITNPPWPHSLGQPTIGIALHLSDLLPTWLLLSADFKHNLYFTKSGLAQRCQKIVSVGRVSWMENGTGGKDNAAWYLFDRSHDGDTVFHGRAA